MLKTAGRIRNLTPMIDICFPNLDRFRTMFPIFIDLLGFHGCDEVFMKFAFGDCRSSWQLTMKIACTFETLFLV